MPKSTPCVQLPGFSTLYLYTGLSRCVASLRVQSFVSKAALLNFMALDKDLTHATMLNFFAQDVLNLYRTENGTMVLLYTNLEF